jgi:hypothetical protein
MPKPATFPSYGDVPAKASLDNLARLLNTGLFDTQYIDAKAAASLLASGMKAYRESLTSPRWQTSSILQRIANSPLKINMVFAAMFDMICNAEYIHGRVTNRSWIYCNRDREHGNTVPHAYFSFLKQCPKCCQDRGLDSRLSGAQHKPSSHHIGEITTTATALLLTLLCKTAPKPLEIGVIGKQSHDVDAVGWSNDLLVLFEVKASPLVTYPVRTRLAAPYTEDTDDGPRELAQHKLIDVDYQSHDLSLYLANLDFDIPLGRAGAPTWPYGPLRNFISEVDGFLTYVEAWTEIFAGYSVPKVQRTGRDITLGYLANGWGDEIDSNKTKAGLGRTDDIKKGTYQLLKFGAYYRDGSPTLPIRGTLLTNLDPLFMYTEYMEKLLDARWAPAGKFSLVPERPDHQQIKENDLFYLYDAVLAFNKPAINDALLSSCFDFQTTQEALCTGNLDSLLNEWEALLP